GCAPAGCRDARIGRSGALRTAPAPRDLSPARSPGHLEIVTGREVGPEQRQIIGALLEAKAVLRLRHDVGGEPFLVVLQREIAPHERAAALLALKGRMDDQLAGV